MMFTDSEGETWTLRLEAKKVEAINELLGIDLIECPGKLWVNIEAFLGCMCVAAIEDILIRDISIEVFCLRLTPEVIPQAMNAFVLELANFLSIDHPDMADCLQIAWTENEIGKEFGPEMASA